MFCSQRVELVSEFRYFATIFPLNRSSKSSRFVRELYSITKVCTASFNFFLRSVPLKSTFSLVKSIAPWTDFYLFIWGKVGLSASNAQNSNLKKSKTKKKKPTTKSGQTPKLQTRNQLNLTEIGGFIEWTFPIFVCRKEKCKAFFPNL